MRYECKDNWVVGHNLNLFSNRAIYVGNTSTFILAGDKPVLRFGKKRCFLGTLRYMLQLSEGEKPLEACSNVDTYYRSGEFIWEIRDESFEGMIRLHVCAPENQEGMACSIELPKGISARLIYGGLLYVPGAFSLCPARIRSERIYAETAFEERWTDGNQANVSENNFSLTNRTVNEQLEMLDHEVTVKGIADTNLFVKGRVVEGFLEDGREHYFYVERGKEVSFTNPKEAFLSGKNRAKRLNEQVKFDVSDGVMCTALGISIGEIDGVWYPPVTVHGGLRWNVPFLGWLIKYGNSVCGWHERAKEEFLYYFDFQHKEDDKRSRKADESRLLTEPALDSRFYGLGHIDKDQAFYNMQTQFFHQAIHAWRMTGDEELEKALYPALELHTKWQEECFDADGDGLYESVINTWPTDSVWGGGNGCIEETCYAYAANLAAAEMAERAGNEESAKKHKKTAEKIKKAFFEQLWLPKKGYAGTFREWRAHRRVQEDAWLYSSFMPIEVGLLNTDEMLQSADYSRYALENELQPGGGRLVWFSNWTPGIWSVREKSNGENLQQAAACFKAGFWEYGYELLKGVISGAFNSESMAAIDFPVAETAPLLVKTMLEDVFGYQPDYPNGKVMIRPAFLYTWDRMSIEHPDVQIYWERSEEETFFKFSLKKTAQVKIILPVYTEWVQEVIGGENVTFIKGIGRQLAEIDFGTCREGTVVVKTNGEKAPVLPEDIETNPMDIVEIEGNILSISDPQEILENWKMESGKTLLKLKNISGNHMVLAYMKEGACEFIRPIRLNIAETLEEKSMLSKQHFVLPAKIQYKMVELSSILNGNVEEIFKQKYRSPRPDTISAQIGEDGFSPWTFTHWKAELPDIHLEKKGKIYTEDGIPLLLEKGNKNIAFTSLWDNWPDKVTVPIEQEADMIFVHIAGSTNPLQCGMENARLLFAYEDGSVEKVSLIPPVNYMSLCDYPVRATGGGAALARNSVFGELDKYCLPKKSGQYLQLGKNLQSILIRYCLNGKKLKSVTLETMSLEVVVGMLSITLGKR